MFAASDRPTVVYSSNKKLVFSNLNENEVRAGAPDQTSQATYNHTVVFMVR